MYSYEERIRAVRLYIKLGKRTALTIRQSGYPTKDALGSRHREYERCYDLPAGYTRAKRKYSQGAEEPGGGTLSQPRAMHCSNPPVVGLSVPGVADGLDA